MDQGYFSTAENNFPGSVGMTADISVGVKEAKPNAYMQNHSRHANVQLFHKLRLSFSG